MRAYDIPALVSIIDRVVTETPAYLSHGDMQTGIALHREQFNPQRGDYWRGHMLVTLGTYPQGNFVAQREDGAFAGFILTSVQRISDPYLEFGVLEDFCVLPEHRGLGIGQRLLMLAITQLKIDRIQRVFFESGVQNALVHERMQEIGFQPVSVTFMAHTETLSVGKWKHRRKSGTHLERMKGTTRS